MKRIIVIGTVVAAGLFQAGRITARLSGRYSYPEINKTEGISASMLYAQANADKETLLSDPSVIGNKLICPVIKTQFNASKNSPKSEYKGKVYIFCCPSCKPRFDKNPEEYIKK